MSDKNEGIQQNTNNLKPQLRGGLCSISGSIAAMFLKNAIRKGYGLSIPSLGIEIKGTLADKRGKEK
jgi:hypothetical protein